MPVKPVPVKPMPVNQIIGNRYEILPPAIGQGGMGVVFRAYDAVTRRHVAVKTLRGAVERTDLDLFETEWSVLARVSHPNIVDILDTGEFEEEGQTKPYFVMPLLPGQTLERLIRERSPRLTAERTVEILVQACRGLQAAHDQGLVHRDLKPSNIFVMEDDTVKIIDFGVVYLTEARTFTGVKGTIDYMAPEQVELKAASPQSDIFSLGVMAYEALTGERPFARFSGADLIEAIRKHIPPPASEINDRIPPVLSQTIHKAMAKQPFHRYLSAREFAETLQKAVRNEHIERFDLSRLQPRLERTKKAIKEGDYQFAHEILTEVEAEGFLDPEMPALRREIDHAIRTGKLSELLGSAKTRFVEGEYPLALQKVHEALDLDPTSAEGIALKTKVERQRSATQLGASLDRIQQQLDSGNLGQARRGVDDLFRISPSHARGRELLREIERREEAHHQPAPGETAHEKDSAQPAPDGKATFDGTRDLYREPSTAPPLSRDFRPIAVPTGSPAPGGGAASPFPDPFRKPLWVAIGGLLILAVSGLAILSQRPKPPGSGTSLIGGTIAVEIRPVPKGAHLLLDDKPIENSFGTLPGQYRLTATLDGYRPLTQTLVITPDAKSPVVAPITLEPLPLELRINSDLKAGKVLVDGKRGDLFNGDFLKSDITPGKHTVRVTNGAKNLVGFNLRSEPGGAATIEAVDASSVPALIVSTFSKSATVWASGGLKGGMTAGTVENIPSSGLALPLTKGDNFFFLDDGKTKQKITLEPSPSARISVTIASARQVGTLVLHANIPAATIIVNGSAWHQSLTNGNAILGLPPKTYRVQLQHEGYQPSVEQSVDLKTGDSRTLQFEMIQLVRKGTFSFERFPPDTEINIDGKHEGITGADGLLRAEINAGPHSLTFRKQGFEDVSLYRDARPDTLNVISGELLMRALGTVVLKTTPLTARVTYRREGEPQHYEAISGQRLTLKSGTYEFAAQAEKYDTKTQSVTVPPGRTVNLNLSLAPASREPHEGIVIQTLANTMADPREWNSVEGWWEHPDQGYGWFRMNQDKFSLNVRKQSSRVFFVNKTKHVEWVADYRDEGNRIVYVLDDHQLRRHAVVDGKAEPEVRSAREADSSSTWQIDIEISGERIVVKDRGGRVLDEYKRPKPLTPLGRFGFRGPVALSIANAH